MNIYFRGKDYYYRLIRSTRNLRFSRIFTPFYWFAQFVNIIALSQGQQFSFLFAPLKDKMMSLYVASSGPFSDFYLIIPVALVSFALISFFAGRDRALKRPVKTRQQIIRETAMEAFSSSFFDGVLLIAVFLAASMNLLVNAWGPQDSSYTEVRLFGWSTLIIGFIRGFMFRKLGLEIKDPLNKGFNIIEAVKSFGRSVRGFFISERANASRIACLCSQ